MLHPSIVTEHRDTKLDMACFSLCEAEALVCLRGRVHTRQCAECCPTRLTHGLFIQFHLAVPACLLRVRLAMSSGDVANVDAATSEQHDQQYTD